MLKQLHLKNVGPSPEMVLEFGPRLNLITGDNGLGKSFLLDVAWWALTRKWPQDLNAMLTSGYAARPTDLTRKATIGFEVESKSGRVAYESRYVADEQSWLGKAGRPWNPGLVVYALADGGFAVWDPARNYWKRKGDADIQDHVPAYVFSPKDVWDGLRVSVGDKPAQVSNGLVADWASWIRERRDDAARMAAVLAVLAPSCGDYHVRPGRGFARLSLHDARDIPTIDMGYGQDIPILHASLGVRRIVALAYMLSWAWREHLVASRLLGQAPSARVVMLFDEIEAHLHPRWQRAVIPALLQVIEPLTQDAQARVQLIAATHSPLILASVESLFDNKRDGWFDLDFEDRQVVLRKRPFIRRGEVGNWLTSEAFDLLEPRSQEAEEAIRAALALVTQARPHRDDIERVENLLRRSLGDTDRFWVRWTHFQDGLRPEGRTKN